MSVFESSFLNSVELKNHLLLAPVKTALAEKGGAVTEALIAYYLRRVQGGAGALISEPMFIDARGKEHPKQVAIDDDNSVEGLKKLCDAVHQAGGKIFAHINHAGRAANPKAMGQMPEAPSVMKCGTTGAEAEEMSSERADSLVVRFIAAAERAKKAGFDGIEVQAGLGYLLAQFWSARTNKRDDKYGGDDEKRQKFARDVVQGIRQKIGQEMPLIARLSGDEKAAGGLDLPANIALAKKMVSWGVDAIHVVSGSACDSPPFYYQHMALPDGLNENFAKVIKAAVDVPVIVAGRMAEPERIRKAIDDNLADYVALGRPLVADPDLPKKMQAGDDDKVLQCGSCLQGCLASVKAGQSIGCIVNPEVGHELEAVQAPPKPIKIAVVGGGPAGMSFAIQAQQRGHKVELFEKQKLGGQFTLAPLAPGKAGMARPLHSLERLCRTSGAIIHEDSEITLEELQSLDVEKIVLASGAQPIVLPLKGFEHAVTGNQVLEQKANVGKRVLIVGGGLIGIEVAEMLLGQGHEITVVELLEDIARDMEMITRKLTMMRLQDKPIEILTQTKIKSYDDGKAIIEDQNGEREIGPFDSLVVAAGTRPNNKLAEELKQKGLDFEMIGDLRALNQIMGAVRDARELVNQLD